VGKKSGYALWLQKKAYEFPQTFQLNKETGDDEPDKKTTQSLETWDQRKRITHSRLEGRCDIKGELG